MICWLAWTWILFLMSCVTVRIRTHLNRERTRPWNAFRWLSLFVRPEVVINRNGWSWRWSRWSLPNCVRWFRWTVAVSLLLTWMIYIVVLLSVITVWNDWSILRLRKWSYVMRNVCFRRPWTLCLTTLVNRALLRQTPIVRWSPCPTVWKVNKVVSVRTCWVSVLTTLLVRLLS